MSIISVLRTTRLALASMAAVFAFALGAIESAAQTDEAQAGQYPIMSLGSESAQVTVTEYASLTCPHCASFHARVFPTLKQNYIDTGKIRYEVVEVYFNRYGLIASVVARCGGPDKYFDLIDLMYAKQPEWSSQPTGNKMLMRLSSLARSVGVSEEQLNQCIRDEEMVETLVSGSDKLMSRHGISSTPSFVINGKTYKNMSYDEMAGIIDEALN
ncbi:MAG: DsbA family protein [Rhodobacteraceae bacterium]|nr:DsbA family protein [Paracoccaceae bacterium]